MPFSVHFRPKPLYVTRTLRRSVIKKNLILRGNYHGKIPGS